jgi:drug/metabolite transporter (DMT)-like permease
MNNHIETTITPNNSKTAAGVILLAIGSVLLINQFDLFAFPDWLFSWPMWIIAWGLYMGAKYNFRKTSWIIITLIGVAFLLDNNIYNADRVIWPVAIMGLGAWFIFKPRQHKEVYYFGKPKETFEFDKTIEPEA